MRSFVRESLKVLMFLAVVLACAAGVLKAFFVDIVRVGHSGMAPTMFVGDQVVMWRGAELQRDDIALCRHPSQPGRFVVGRVAAMPGESLRLERGTMFVAGFRSSRDGRGQVRFVDPETARTYRMNWGIEDYSSYQTHLFFDRADRAFAMRDQAAVRGLFLLSDNRGHVGEDSRAFGVVQPENCLGQIFMRLRATDTGVPEEIPHGHLDLLD